jgi:putative hydrolase of the HAD superfamily
MIQWIAFDADDTLWHSECYYHDAQQRFLEILSPYLPDGVRGLDVLHEIEIRNLPDFGYGIKGFGISMIEAAIHVSGGQIIGSEIQKIVEVAREMIHHEIRLLDHVQETVESLAASHPLMLITKGDLMDQERKIQGSGLRNYFQSIEIVSDKTALTYRALFQKYQINPEAFLMVGNSMRSDIMPVIDLGGWGVHVPYTITWAHETVQEKPANPDRFFELEHLGPLPSLIAEIIRQAR